MATHLKSLFEASHSVQETRVVGAPVRTSMHAPVAIRAKTYDERGMIWPAITHTSYMVWLQVVATVTPHKRCGSTATFTGAAGTGQHVVSNVGASLVDGARFATRLGLANACGCVGKRAKRFQVIKDWRCRFHSLYYAVDMAETKDDDLSHRAVGITTLSPFEALADHLADKYYVTLRIALVKQQQRSPIDSMIADRFVATDVLLIAALPLSKVEDRTVFQNLVVIAVLWAASTGHDEDDVMSRRRNDARLLTAAEPSVNILAPIVGAPLLETVAHRRSPKLSSANDNEWSGDSLQWGLEVVQPLGRSGMRKLANRDRLASLIRPPRIGRNRFANKSFDILRTQHTDAQVLRLSFIPSRCLLARNSILSVPAFHSEMSRLPRRKCIEFNQLKLQRWVPVVEHGVIGFIEDLDSDVSGRQIVAKFVQSCSQSSKRLRLRFPLSPNFGNTLVHGLFIERCLFFNRINVVAKSAQRFCSSTYRPQHSGGAEPLQQAALHMFGGANA